MNMLNLFKFLPRQWKLIAVAISNIAQAIILFSLAAFFVPEVVNLSKEFSRTHAFLYLLAGILILMGSGIIMRRGNN